MKKRVLIETRELGLALPLRIGRERSLKGLILNRSVGRQKSTIYRPILTNINLKIFSGESLSIVGRNGTGKSSLLRLLSGIFAPSVGSVNSFGTISPLIELDGAFSGELTVEENISLLLTLLEVAREKHAEISEAILEFSELRDFSFQQMRTLSTGMKARFAFAFATSFPADLILIDESLSVGDSSFSKKAISRIEEKKRQGVSIVLVTHDLQLAREITSKCLWLEEGSTVLFGRTKRVLEKYEKSL